MKNKLVGLLLLIGYFLNAQIPDLKAVTFQDMAYLIANEGFVQKGQFDSNSNKCATKSEILAALYLDDSGQIDSYASNQLVPRIYLVPITGGVKGFMAWASDNVENQNHKGVVYMNLLHDGNYTLPVVGDRVYRDDGSIYNYSQNDFFSQPFHGVQRYPSVGSNEEVNIKLGTDGFVEWVGWVTDENDLPTGVAATEISYYSFNLNWSGGTKYHNVRYFIEQEQLSPSVLPWTIYQELDNDNEFTDGYNFQVPISNVTRSNWRIRSVATSHRSHEKWDKVSAEIEVDPLISYGAVLHNTNDANNPCSPISAQTAQIYSSTPIANVVAGGYFYTDKELTTVWLPDQPEVMWWSTSGETKMFRMGNDGFITGVATCP